MTILNAFPNLMFIIKHCNLFIIMFKLSLITFSRHVMGYKLTRVLKWIIQLACVFFCSYCERLASAWSSSITITCRSPSFISCSLGDICVSAMVWTWSCLSSLIYGTFKDSPAASLVKNLPANVGDVHLIPGWGRSPREENGNSFQYSCLGNPMGRGTWQPQSMRSQRVGYDWETEQACTHSTS